MAKKHKPNKPKTAVNMAGFVLPDYSSQNKLKKMIANCFDEKARMVAEFRGDDILKGSDTAGRNREKRKNAVLETIPRAKEEFGRLYPKLLSVEESLTKLEATPNGGFDMINEMDNLLLGAALWILDDLKRTSKIIEACKLMPTSFEQLETVDLPLDFYDPCFEYELIKSVMYVLQMRHSDYKGWENSRTFVDAWIGIENRQPSEARENCKKLIALLDQERVEAACRKFEEKQWEFLHRYFKAVNTFEERQNAASIRLMNLINRMEKPDPKQLNVLMMKSPTMRFGGAFDRDMAEKMQLLSELEDAERKIAGLEFAAPALICMDEEEVIGLFGCKDIVEMLTLEIDDPYELCFATIGACHY